MSENKNSETNPSALFSVNALAQNQRFDVWKDSMNCIFDVNAEKAIRQGEFHGTVDARLYSNMMLAKTESTEQTWTRSSSVIAQDGMDHYMLQIYLGGSMHHSSSNKEFTVEKDRMVLFDLSQQTETVTSDFSNLSLIIPRSRLEGALDQPEDHNMKVLDANEGITSILRDTYLSLFKNIDLMSGEHSERVLSSITDLLATSLNSSEKYRIEDYHQHQATTVYAVKRYIQSQISDPDLSPAKISMEMGFSRSKLYRIFQNVGGITEYIRQQRLQKAYHMLTQPQFSHIPIYQVALEFGYNTDNSFIRAFRERFGMTPGDVRHRRSKDFKELDLNDDILDKRYEDWLFNLS